MKKYVIRNSVGQKITIFAKNITDALSQVEDSKFREDRLEKGDRLTFRKQPRHESKITDEASTATTINALVDDEKSAIGGYNLAISNLRNKLDEKAMQVLINIRNDERRHIENLYSILNGNITEKNLEDSTKNTYIVNRKHGFHIEDSRADMIETTIMTIANNIYRKKDAFGLPMSQKDLDEVINMIVQSPVFKRLVEQAVRDWIKEANPYDINIK